MIYQIVSLLLEVTVGLVGGACFLRLYMQLQRIPMSERSGNPLARFVFALTDWLVLPLRRVVPAFGRWDTASLLGLYLLEIGRFGVMWILIGGGSGGLASVPIAAFFGAVRVVIAVLTGLTIAHAVLSWVQTNNLLADILERLCSPLLVPIRRLMPLIGGIDLSPVVLLVLLQICGILLGELERFVLLL